MRTVRGGGQASGSTIHPRDPHQGPENQQTTIQIRLTVVLRKNAITVSTSVSTNDCQDLTVARRSSARKQGIPPVACRSLEPSRSPLSKPEGRWRQPIAAPQPRNVYASYLFRASSSPAMRFPMSGLARRIYFYGDSNQYTKIFNANRNILREHQQPNGATHANMGPAKATSPFAATILDIAAHSPRRSPHMFSFPVKRNISLTLICRCRDKSSLADLNGGSSAGPRVRVLQLVSPPHVPYNLIRARAPKPSVQ